jgi:hypothetical protein
LAVAAGIACLIGSSGTASRLAAPTITSVSPKSGMPGSNVYVNGTNLAGASVVFTLARPSALPTTVTPDDTSVTPSGTRIVVTVPDGSDAAGGVTAATGPNRITVTTAGGSAVSPAPFIVKGRQAGTSTPMITGLGPQKARPGAIVTIFGKNFGGTMSVKLGGTKARFTVPSESRIVVKVPRHARSGHWSIETSSGLTTSPARFTVIEPSM